MDKPWAFPALVGVASFIAAGATLSVPTVSGALTLLGTSGVVFAIIAAVKARKDPYSLDALREFHEKEELAEIDVPGVHDDGEGDVMCGRCKNHYSGRLRGCPFCGAAR